MGSFVFQVLPSGESASARVSAALRAGPRGWAVGDAGGTVGKTWERIRR